MQSEMDVAVLTRCRRVAVPNAFLAHEARHDFVESRAAVAQWRPGEVHAHTLSYHKRWSTR